MTSRQIAIGNGDNFAAELPSALAADALLGLHALFVLFVILGLVLTLIGGITGWQWVRITWFRYLHLAAILFVVIQTWLGLPCPLTVWEIQLRARGGGVVYDGDFIAHWVEELLYYEAPAWVFVTAYSLFGLLTLLSWTLVRPRGFQSRR
ncbi:MAG: DUF2784 domain-containing protein [Pseudohongiellaceae bacterium]